MSEITPRLFSVLAILAVCGVTLSSVSLQRHYAISKTAYCDIGQTFNCDVVNRSEYSTILGIPVALIGMLGYGALAGLASVYRERPGTPALLFGGSFIGLVFSLYLTYVEGHLLGVWCILCLTSFALIILITMLAAVIFRQAGKASGSNFPHKE